MKILITTDCYKPTINGVVTSILNLETELRKRGNEVKILCPSENIHCTDSGDVYRIGSVGGGPYLETLKELTESEGVSDKVIFTGAVSPDKIALYYRLGDIFLSASQSETQGLTYIEAIASGLPAVCRKDQCLEGVVENGVNGGQYNDFEEFSQLVKGLFDNKKAYNEMSENAAKTAQRYSAEAFAKNVESLYNDVLEKREHYETEDTLYNCENCG